MPADNRIVFCRAVLLMGVLAGLLFSCGEGIRLFPFPPETGAAQNKDSGGWKSDDRRDYQENLHRFESRQENQQSKIRRGDDDNQPPRHYWANACNAPLNDAPHFDISTTAAAGKTDVSFRARRFKSNLFSVSGASRAPPSRAS